MEIELAYEAIGLHNLYRIEQEHSTIAPNMNIGHGQKRNKYYNNKGQRP